jgi:hypothetical protein
VRPGVRRAGLPRPSGGADAGRAAAQRRRLDKMSGWPHAVESIGAAGLHVHDLRHTGNQFAANSGAALKDLMTRMGTTANALR